MYRDRGDRASVPCLRAGNVTEPEATSRLGIGWYLTAALLLTLTVLAIVLMRRARPTTLRK